MSDQFAPAAVKDARDAAVKARQLSDEHQHAYRDVDPADAELVRRGDELKRLAAEASARFEVVKQHAHSAALAKRRQQSIADDAQLQARLRAEAQARRETAAASEPPPPRHGHR